MKYDVKLFRDIEVCISVKSKNSYLIFLPSPINILLVSVSFIFGLATLYTFRLPNSNCFVRKIFIRK